MKKPWAIAGWIGAVLLAAAYLYPARSLLNPRAQRYFPPDFMQFYFAGKLAAAGRIADLYHRPAYEPLLAEMRSQGERLNATNSHYFNRPAFAAWFCIPLAWLPYRHSLFFVALANLVLLCLLVWKLPAWFGAPPGARWFLLAFAPFLQSIGLSQDALLLTFMLGAAIHLASERKEISAGLMLGFCAFKPHLILAMPAALLAARRWKTAGALLAAALALALASFAAVGTAGVREWAALLRAPSTDYLPGSMGNLRAVALHCGAAAGLAAGLLALACFAIVLRRGGLREKAAGAILASLLISPHTYLYDYSLLAIVAALAAPAAAYLLLLPWPLFYPREDMLPWLGIVLAYFVFLAAQSCRAPDAEGKPASRSLAPQPDFH